MDTGLTVVVATGGVAAYFFLRYRLLKASEPMHLELAGRGERLLSNPNLHSAHRQSVEFMLDSSYSRWVLPFVVVVMPFMVGWLIASRKMRNRRTNRKHSVQSIRRNACGSSAMISS